MTKRNFNNNSLKPVRIVLVLLTVLIFTFCIFIPGLQADLLKNILSHKKLEREQALSLVEKKRPADLIPLLKNVVLSGKSLYKKNAALDALEKYPLRTHLSLWIEMLEGTGSFVIKDRIIKQLGKSQDRRIVIPVSRELSSRFSTVRKSAIRVLKRMGDDRMLPFIFNLAKDEDPAHRVYGIQAISHVYDRRMQYLISDLLRDDDKYARYYVLNCIERNGLSDSLSHVRNLAISDKNWEVRIKALNVLKRLRDNNITYIMLKTITDANREVRLTSAINLASYRNRAKSYIISSQLEIESDEFIKDILIEILINMNSIGNMDGLRKILLHDKNEKLRIKAAYACGKIRDARAIPALLDAMDDPDVKVKAEACNSVKYFRKNRKVLRRLLEIIVDEPDRYVRSAALYSIEYIGDKSVRVSLFDIYAVENDPVLKEKLRLVVRDMID